MKIISKLLKEIISEQTKINYFMPEIVNAPLRIEEIRSVENELKIVFNDELKEYFKTMNGVNLKGSYNSGLTGIIPIFDLSEINLSKEAYLMTDWELIDDMFDFNFNNEYNFFPIMNDGCGEEYWVNLNEGASDYGKILYTASDGESPSYHFNSLQKMFESILAGYKLKIFKLDQDSHLACDYKQWSKLCEKLNPEIAYWKNDNF